MYCPFSTFVYDFSVNLKSKFGKTKRGRSLICVILDNQYRPRVKGNQHILAKTFSDYRMTHANFKS